MDTVNSGSEDKTLPSGWRWATLGEVCKPISTVNPKNKPETAFSYVEISSIDRELKSIAKTKTILGKDAPSRARRKIRLHDILVSTTRPNLNAVALVPEHLDSQVCSTGICVLRPNNEIDPRYLFNFVKTTRFIYMLSRDANGTMYPAVTDKHVLDITIPIPPIEEQKRIASILDWHLASIEKVKKLVEDQLNSINAMPEAYLRKAFSGEL